MTIIFSCAIIPIVGALDGSSKYVAYLITKDERKEFHAPTRAEVLDQVFAHLKEYERSL